MAFWLRAKQGLPVCLRNIFFCIEGHNLNPRNHTHYPICYLRVWEISHPQAPLPSFLLPLSPPPSPSISLARTYHLVAVVNPFNFYCKSHPHHHHHAFCSGEWSHYPLRQDIRPSSCRWSDNLYRQVLICIFNEQGSKLMSFVLADISFTKSHHLLVFVIHCYNLFWLLPLIVHS